MPKDKKLVIGKIFLYRVGVLSSVFMFFVAALFLFLSFLVYVFLSTNISYKYSRLEETKKQLQMLQKTVDKKRNHELTLLMDNAAQDNVSEFSQSIQFIINTFAKTENVYLDSLNIEYKNIEHKRQDGQQHNNLESGQIILSISIDARANSKADIIKLLETLKKQKQITNLNDSLLLSSIRKINDGSVIFKLKFNYEM